MHHVGTLSATPADNGVYASHSEACTRLPIVDRAAGSVHQALTIVELAAGGHVERHLHAFEEGLFVLEGAVRLELAGVDEDLRSDDYCFIEKAVPHALANGGSTPCRWLELSAPQPGMQGAADTVFLERVSGELPELPYRRGRFDEHELPPPSSTIGLEGFGAANVGGASLRMMIDREFGASQFNLFVVQYGPGGLIKEHDHPFEEAFFFVSGEIEAVLDGEVHTLRAGDYCWSGVGSMHSFANRRETPVRWIETQVPQPPSRHQARFTADWERVTSTVATA